MPEKTFLTRTKNLASGGLVVGAIAYCLFGWAQFMKSYGELLVEWEKNRKNKK